MKNSTEPFILFRWRILYTIACGIMILLEVPIFKAHPELVPITAAIFIVMWFISLQTENYTPLVLPATVQIASSLAYPTQTVVATVFIYALAILFSFRTLVAYLHTKFMDMKNT